MYSPAAPRIPALQAENYLIILGYWTVMSLARCVCISRPVLHPAATWTMACTCVPVKGGMILAKVQSLLIKAAAALSRFCLFIYYNFLFHRIHEYNLVYWCAEGQPLLVLAEYVFDGVIFVYWCCLDGSVNLGNFGFPTCWWFWWWSPVCNGRKLPGIGGTWKRSCYHHPFVVPK